jgi:hypothetical protein
MPPLHAQSDISVGKRDGRGESRFFDCEVRQSRHLGHSPSRIDYLGGHGVIIFASTSSSSKHTDGSIR